MQPIAQGLSDADMPPLAAYFSSQHAPLIDEKAAVSPEMTRAGKQLAEVGATSCFSCHGAGGKGNGSRYPSIAGQPARFVIDRLHEFQRRAQEKPAKPGSMTAVAAMMSEQQIEVSAAYLSQLPR
jgi:cytochrome c553